jgi:hypothetical protein
MGSCELGHGARLADCVNQRSIALDKFINNRFLVFDVGMGTTYKPMSWARCSLACQELQRLSRCVGVRLRY